MPKKANNVVFKILNHPDKEELLSKIIIGIDISDINQWLSTKYSAVSEKKYVISTTSLQKFKDNYLDIYNIIQQDLMATKTAVNNNSEEDLQLAINNLPAYKDVMVKAANEELDIRKIIKNLCLAIETRVGQIYDIIQEDPRNLNTRHERVFMDMCEKLGNILEKYYKFTEQPATNVVQNNISLQFQDKSISAIHDIIKKILSQMNEANSFHFIEMLNEEISKLKLPSEKEVVGADVRLAEVKLLNETINKKLNDHES